MDHYEALLNNVRVMVKRAEDLQRELEEAKEALAKHHEELQRLANACRWGGA